MVPNVLSIAGSDPSGGAGVQADVKTISASGCYALAVITALTAQNTHGVSAMFAPPSDFVVAQIEAVFADVRIDAVKIGMLGTAAIANAVADCLSKHRPRFIVLDPVLAASSGDSLADPELLGVLRNRLLPLATLTTPNLPEAARLADDLEYSGDDAQIEKLALRLLNLGTPAVLMKGGHRPGPDAKDVLFTSAAPRVYSAVRVKTTNTHGTGCALSSSIAAGLARGLPLDEAVGEAKRYVTGALAGGDRLSVGGGHGPLDHFWRHSDRAGTCS